MQWDAVGALTFVWATVYASVFQGAQWTSKVIPGLWADPPPLVLTCTSILYVYYISDTYTMIVSSS